MCDCPWTALRSTEALPLIMSSTSSPQHTKPKPFKTSFELSRSEV
jgi:hypothetical protein